MESDAGGGGGGKSPFRQRDTAHVATNALKSTQIEGIYDVVESAFDPSGPPCPSGADSSSCTGTAMSRERLAAPNITLH